MPRKLIPPEPWWAEAEPAAGRRRVICWDNELVKALVSKMVESGLSPKTVRAEAGRCTPPSPQCIHGHRSICSSTR